MKKYLIACLFCAFVCFALSGAVACKKVVAVSGVSFYRSALELYVGDEYQLEYTVLPDNASNTDVSFFSSNKEIVSVEADGKVSAVSPGEVTVTVTTADSNYSDSCVITVKAEEQNGGTEDYGNGEQDENQDQNDGGESGYTVTFMADGEIIAVRVYTEDDPEIDEPTPPYKNGYSVEWESYSLDRENIIVNAVYTLITYNISFIGSDGNAIYETTYTVESESITEPQVPSRDYYSGKWEEYKLIGGDLIVNAVYTPIEYAVKFIANGETISEQTYTIENKSIVIPDLPAVDGYTAVWEEIELSFSDIIVYAVYTPIEYVITFRANGFLVENVTFTVESQSIKEPSVPSMAGYDGVWESYSLICDNITVNAVYTIINYTITYANTKGAENSNPESYNCENVFAFEDITVIGYIFEGWYIGDEKITSVNSSYGDLTITAKWSLIQYEIRFVGENYELITAIYYTVEDSEEIVLPEVPVKEGYTGSWSKFELTNENDIVVVRAVYTKN